MNWVNSHYLKEADNQWLAEQVQQRIINRDGDPQAVDLPEAMGLLKDRSETLEQLADAAMLFCGPAAKPAAELVDKHITDEAKAAIVDFWAQAGSTDWSSAELGALLKSILKSHSLKMPHFAIPLRLIVAGNPQTPAIDAVLALMGRDRVGERLRAFGLDCPA